jgi:rare lipoprotein A
VAARWQLLTLCAVGVVIAAVAIVQYQRHAAEVAAERTQDAEEERWTAAAETEPAASPRPRDSTPPPKKGQARAPLKAREVYAAWYDVPDDSLAKRRAAQELTAAHNRLPLGTLVRVTHLKNGKSVVVRITDRGIRDRRVKIDLCKEAAEEIDMLRNGLARVRMEIIPEEYGPTAADSYTAAPHP